MFYFIAFILQNSHNTYWHPVATRWKASQFIQAHTCLFSSSSWWYSLPVSLTWKLMNLPLQGLSSLFSVPFKGSGRECKCPVTFWADFENPVLSRQLLSACLMCPSLWVHEPHCSSTDLHHHQTADWLLLISFTSSVVSAKGNTAPLCSRTHTQLADKISAPLKITFYNLWRMGGISDNEKSKRCKL